MTPKRTRSALGWLAAGVLTACSGDPEATKRGHITAGDALVEQQKYQEAIVEYRSALRVDERFAEARSKLAAAFERAGDPERALRERIRAADLLPDDVDAQLAAGRMLAATGRFADAKTRAERALVLDPKNVDAQLLVGHALLGLRDLDGALREVEAAIELDPLEGRTYLSYGVMQLGKGDVARAEEAFSKALTLQPTAAEPRLALATFQWLKGQRAEAEQTLAAGLATTPDEPRLNRALAAMYMSSGRAAEAEVHFRRVADVVGDARSRLALADYYIAVRKWDAAITTLNGLAGHPEAGTTAKMKLAAIAYSEGRTSEAHQMIDQLIASGTSGAPPLLLKGRFLLAEERIDGAIAELQKAVAADAKLAAGHYLLGDAYTRANRLSSAVAAYRRAVEAAPKAVSPYVQLARVLLLRAETAAALTAAQRAVELDPANPVARIVLVDALIGTRDVAGADRELALLMRRYGGTLTWHLLDGKVQTVKGKYDAARQAFTRALALESDSVDAQIGLIFLDLATGAVAEARKRAEPLLSGVASNPALPVVLARVFAVTNDIPRAVAILGGVLRDDPDHHVVRMTLGELYASAGQHESALREFDELTTRNPKSASAHLAAAGMLYRMKRMGEARQRYETVLELEPESGPALNNLAWILADTGQDLERALSLAKRAAEQHPDDAAISDTVGWVYYQMRLPLLAIPAFEQAIKTDATNPRFHYRLGRAHAAAGNVPQARVHLERALAISQTFDGAADARTQLAALPKR